MTSFDAIRAALEEQIITSFSSRSAFIATLPNSDFDAPQLADELAAVVARIVEGAVVAAKAEALREAADGWQAYIRAMNFGTTYPIEWLRARAERVEGG